MAWGVRFSSCAIWLTVISFARRRYTTRRRVSSARSWNASGSVMTLNAFMSNPAVERMLVFVYKPFHNTNEGFNNDCVYYTNMRWNKSSRVYSREGSHAGQHDSEG